MNPIHATIWFSIILFFVESGMSQEPPGRTDPRNLNNKVLVDDVEGQRHHPVEQANAEELIKFPEFLDLNGVNPEVSMNTKTIRQGKRTLVKATQLIADGRLYRVFVFEKTKTLNIKVTRYFDRSEAKTFANIFPEFSEYAYGIPDKNGGFDLDILFGVSASYEFRDTEDLKTRAPELYVWYSRSAEPILEMKEAGRGPETLKKEPGP